MAGNSFGSAFRFGGPSFDGGGYTATDSVVFSMIDLSGGGGGASALPGPRPSSPPWTRREGALDKQARVVTLANGDAVRGTLTDIPTRLTGVHFSETIPDNA